MAVRRLRDADDLLTPAVNKTIEELNLPDSDLAAVRLAKRYAAAIDDAANFAANLADLPYEENLVKQVAALSARVEAQTVLETLGPKLLAVLESLGATPKARAATRKGGAVGAPGQGKLAQIRDARTA